MGHTSAAAVAKIAKGIIAAAEDESAAAIRQVAYAAQAVKQWVLHRPAHDHLGGKALRPVGIEPGCAITAPFAQHGRPRTPFVQHRFGGNAVAALQHQVAPAIVPVVDGHAAADHLRQTVSGVVRIAFDAITQQVAVIVIDKAAIGDTVTGVVAVGGDAVSGIVNKKT